jgi:hypothetical protein
MSESVTGTTGPRIAKQCCGSCPGGLYEVEVPGGTDLEATFEALEAGADAHRAYHAALDAERGVHIRTYAPVKRGNGYYAPKYSASDNGSKTLCGVPAGMDITWDEARYAKNLATVACEDCKRIRARGSRS